MCKESSYIVFISIHLITMNFSSSYEFWPLDFLLCELPVYVFGPFVYLVGVLDVLHLPLQILSQLPHCALGL